VPTADHSHHLGHDAGAIALIPLLMIAVLLFAFGFIAQRVAGGGSSAFDSRILLALRTSANATAVIGPAWLQEAARDITSLGSVVVLMVTTLAVAGYLFLSGRHGLAWLMLIAVLGGLMLNNLLKFAFARPRPLPVAHGARVFTTSFPSGHATLSAITYLTIGALLAQAFPSFPVNVYFMSLATFLTVLVGASRVYLGVHYPTDVIGGWCIGAAWAIGCWALMAWLQHGGQIEPSGRS
jgi:undecaprenyl-diphosphatase